MNRRMFFGRIGAALVGTKLLPDTSLTFGTTGGAHIGALAGAYWSGVDLSVLRDCTVVAVRREWRDDALKFTVLVDTGRPARLLSEAIERLKARA